MSTIIDNGGSGYVETGAGWTTQTAEGYGGSIRYHSSNAGSGVHADFTFTGLSAGATYRVGITWTIAFNRDTSVPITVFDSDGTTVLATFNVNQQNAPSDFADAGFNWMNLGNLTPSGSTLSVRVASGTQGSNYIIADAAQVAIAGQAILINGVIPTTGPLNSSAEFHFQPALGVTATTVVTPTDGGGGGTFAPSTLTWTTGTSDQKVTVYTPGSTGAKSIACTNNQSLPNPGAVTYTVVANGFAYATVQAGNSSDRQTWGGIGPPRNGDTFTYGHDLTIDANMTIGNSPTTPATVVSNTVALKTLTINALLQVRGRLVLEAGTTAGVTEVVVGPGGILEMDSSQAAGTPVYDIKLGTTFTAGATCRIRTAGTSGNPAIIRANVAGGITKTTTDNGFLGGAFVLSYCNANRVGDGSTASFSAAPQASSSVDHCTFNNCGQVQYSSPGGSGITKDASFTVTNSRWVNTPGLGTTFNINVALSNNNTDTGTRTFTGNTFDSQVALPMFNAAVDDNFFPYACSPGGSTYDNRGTFNRNFQRSILNTQVSRVGSWSEGYNVKDASTYDGKGRYSATAVINNPHWNTPVLDGMNTVDHCIFESFGSTGDGDVDYGPNTASRNSRFTYCLFLPDQLDDGAGKQLNAGTLTTNNGWSGEASEYEHNTFYSGGQGPLAIAEGGNGFLHMIAKYRSNAIWNASGTGAYGFNYLAYMPTTPVGIVTDTIDPAFCDFNGAWNVRSDGTHLGSNTNGHYNVPLSATVGVHDVYADPGFVDLTRNFWKWVQSLEPTWGAGTAFPANAVPSRTDYNAHGLYKLSIAMCGATTDPDYDSRYTLAALKTYVRNGFAPTNPAYHNTAHDGTDIGAVAWVSASQTVTPGAALVSVAGINPLVSALGSVGLAPGTALVSTTGVAPFASPAGFAPVVPGFALVSALGVNPSVPLGGVTVVPGVGAVAVTGVDPGVAAGGTVTVTPGFCVVTASAVGPTWTMQDPSASTNVGGTVFGTFSIG